MIVQIYYKESQKSEILPFAVPFFNSGLTIFFENAVIKEVVEQTTEEKIGVCSWKLGQKIRRYKERLIKDAIESDYQVLSFTRNSGRHQMLQMAYAWHPFFKPTIELLWQKLGYKMPGDAKDPIYQNHHCSKSVIYKRYVSEFLAPAMELTEKDEELHALMIKPSGYGRLSRDADLKSVKEKLGMNDYPLAPFILERCYSLWLTMHRIPVKYL